MFTSNCFFKQKSCFDIAAIPIKFLCSFINLMQQLTISSQYFNCKFNPSALATVIRTTRLQSSTSCSSLSLPLLDVVLHLSPSALALHVHLVLYDAMSDCYSVENEFAWLLHCCIELHVCKNVVSRIILPCRLLNQLVILSTSFVLVKASAASNLQTLGTIAHSKSLTTLAGTRCSLERYLFWTHKGENARWWITAGLRQ